jgi:hypothetical protein
MASRLHVELELKIQEKRTIARVSVSETGGPVTNLITGREPHPTGRPVSLKAGFRGMPWESIKAEYPTYKLIEGASPVKSWLAQPHRLDLFVTGPSVQLTYFPDLEMTVDRNFVTALKETTPFYRTALDWRPAGGRFDPCKLIVEVKDDGDPRLDDPQYQNKLKLSAEVYERLGWHFVQIVKSFDLPSDHVEQSVNDVWLDKSVKVTVVDVANAIDTIKAAGGTSVFSVVAAKLGAGPIGRSKLRALHVRRVVLIDLMTSPGVDAPVQVLDDAGALL